jgi:hypothetical protein
LPIRTWRDLDRRQVDHALQDLADHRQVIAVAGILLHDVGKIGGGDIEPLDQQPRHQERHRDPTIGFGQDRLMKNRRLGTREKRQDPMAPKKPSFLSAAGSIKGPPPHRRNKPSSLGVGLY